MEPQWKVSTIFFPNDSGEHRARLKGQAANLRWPSDLIQTKPPCRNHTPHLLSIWQIQRCVEVVVSYQQITGKKKRLIYFFISMIKKIWNHPNFTKHVDSNIVCLIKIIPEKKHKKQNLCSACGCCQPRATLWRCMASLYTETVLI